MPDQLLPTLVPSAHALSAFRELPNGDGRLYTATTFPADPFRGCEQFIRQCRAFGYLQDGGDGYAVLDVLDANGDIVQDFMITTAAAFRWIKKRLDFAVEHLEDDA